MGQPHFFGEPAHQRPNRAADATLCPITGCVGLGWCLLLMGLPGRRIIRQFRRAIQIATISVGQRVRLVGRRRGSANLLNLRCRVLCSVHLSQCHHHVDMSLPLPERMNRVLEALGPTFIKSGQMVAMRPDYVPVEYAMALRRRKTTSSRSEPQPPGP
jgi:hypothetical protein